jgi:hypothetical protein
MLVGRKFGMDAATLLAVLNASSGHVVEFCGRRPGTGSRSHRGGALPRTGRRRLAHRNINLPMSAAILRTAVVRLEVAPAENTTGNASPNGSSAPHPRVDLFGAPLEVSVFAAADRHEGGHGDVRIAINVGGLGRSRARNEHLLVASRAYRRSNDPDACDETMRTGPSWMTNSRR